MELKDYMQKAIDTFYGLISNKEEGAENTRYRSWEWCYKAFSEKRSEYKNASSNEEKEKIVDYLALHLGFYLASWGMYRGSSFLLQRDYKAHMEVVKEILKPEYDILVAYEPENTYEYSKDNRSEANKLLFGDGNEGLYWEIEKLYSRNSEEDHDTPSDTLVTKILMGTLGCVPAFDRFFKAGIAWYKDRNFYECQELSKSIDSRKRNPGKTYAILENIAYVNREFLKVPELQSPVKYPTMKCLDMFFWQVGFELDIIAGFDNAENNKAHLIKTACTLGIIKYSYNEIKNKIYTEIYVKQKNGKEKKTFKLEDTKVSQYKDEIQKAIKDRWGLI